jgi:hypothetical protein
MVQMVAQVGAGQGWVSQQDYSGSHVQESQVAVEMAFDMWRRFPWLDRYQVLKLHIEIHAQLGSGRRVVPTSDKQSPWLEPQVAGPPQNYHEAPVCVE